MLAGSGVRRTDEPSLRTADTDIVHHRLACIMATTPQGRSPSVTSPERTPPNTASAPTTLENYLSYSASAEPIVPVASSSSSTAQARPLLKDRLYVGNLHPSVDE